MSKTTIRKIKKLKNRRNYRDLIKIANNGLFDERFEALKALREIGDNSIIPEIIKCIDDKIQMVSFQAMDTIKAFNPGENTIQLIKKKIEYWNEYNAKNNKKTRHFRRFSNVQLLYHYRLSTTYQEKKKLLRK